MWNRTRFWTKIDSYQQNKISQLCAYELAPPSERGGVMVLVAICIVMLCGFGAITSDLGVVYVQRQQLRVAAEAGALAGAGYLLLQDSSTAANVARQMAMKNDSEGSYTATADTTLQTVDVTGKQTVPWWFARVWGFSQANMQVQSQAAMGTLTSGLGMVPIAVPNQKFNYGQLYYLTSGSGNGSSGNYGFVNLSGPGSSTLETDLEQGYKVPFM